ncbi:MAG TPA: cytochrome c peroxidase [Kofleriaceae bacterium]|nr:cytochrome c peroxidase [Kofleriaceae bacterium]
MVWLATSLAGCGLDAASHDEASSLTIPRVANPPPQSDLINLPGDLRGVAVPGPSNLGDFIADPAAAVALGKALFWDMQVGSDGVQACASCHFRAGADPRSKNQLNPGLKHAPQSDLDYTKGGPNYQITADDFPLTRLATPGVRGALDPATDNNDVVSSQGVASLGSSGLDPVGFNVGDSNTRRVEPRNTPSVINAVFNHRQFWDGRAENVFNGVNHLGARDPNARVVRAVGNESPALVQIALANASLASQAVAPIINDFEMARPGRTIYDVAASLLGRRPLAQQQVHPKDSVLGPLSRSPARGLTTKTYEAMIQQAFRREWWDSSKLVQVAANGSVSFASRADHDPSTLELTVMQYNFALFFGLAIQMYEATLVSDDTPWDRFRRAHPSPTDPALNPWTNMNPDHISRTALFGAMLFNDRTRGATNVRCSNCHEQAELTDASVRRIATAANGPVRNRDGNIIDKGFNNIGVRPTDDDLGVGASDAFGPLSHARRLFPEAPPANFDGAAVSKGFGLDGAFKIPSLRNVELTAPYFHNGDARTLEEAVAFYGRGGSVAPIAAMDGTPIEPLGVPLLNADEIDALVAFLRSLTDERVLYRRAPFDHPQLFVPNGHLGDEHGVRDRTHDELADDELIEIDAVGADGGAPLPGFLEDVFGPHEGGGGPGNGNGQGKGHGLGHDCDDHVNGNGHARI